MAGSAEYSIGAPALIAGSALIAALMSLQAGLLAGKGVPVATITAACGVVGATACFALDALLSKQASASAAADPSLVGLQALLGGVLPHLAFFAISRSGLAVANCLMFTMPLWTAAFAAAFAGAPWGPADAVLSAISLAGVLLVTRPPLAIFGAAADASFSWAGCASGLCFGMCGGALNVLLGGRSLADASPLALNGWQLVATTALAVPALLGRGAALFGGLTATPALLAGLGTVGLFMAATGYSRTLGLQRAADATVATLLYTEIAWCFALEVLVLGMRPAATQLIGATLIVGGAVAYALNERSRGPSDAPKAKRE